MQCINFTKSRGGKSSPRGVKAPRPPLNAALSLGYNVIQLFMWLRKLCDFVFLTKNLFLLNNIYANQIPGQSTCVKSFILRALIYAPSQLLA